MKNKIKNAVLFIFTLALVAGTAVAVTWAVSSNSEMGKRENVFTPDDTVKLAIAEPWWDYLNENGKYEHTNEGNVTENNVETGADVPSDYPTPSSIALTSPVQGEDLAGRYLPDMFIPKNPKLYNMYTKNTGNGDDDNTGAEYVAMTVSYQLLIPTKIMTQNNIFTQASGSNVSSYWVAMSDFSAFSIYTDDNGTPANNTDDKDYLSIDLTYDQFNELAKVYSDISTQDFNSNWTAFDASYGFDEGSAFYYNRVIYAKDSGNLNSTHTNPTEPLFSFVKINAFDGVNDTATLPDSDSNTANTSVKYKLTVPNAGGTDVTLYLNSLPQFSINLQGFAIDANVSEFKSGNAISDLSTLGATPKGNALNALKNLIDKANS